MPAFSLYYIPFSSSASVHLQYWKYGLCKMQTADVCFRHYANHENEYHEYVTAIVPLFSKPKNNSPQAEICTRTFLMSYNQNASSASVLNILPASRSARKPS